MRKFMVARVVFILSLAAMANLQDVSAAAADDNASEQAIRGTLAAWVRANNSGDAAGANSIWAPKMVGWFPAAPEFGEGAALALAGVTLAKGSAYSTYELAIDEVAVSGAIAAVHDVWTETLHFNGSPALVRRVIRGSELWRLQPDGKWRIARFVSAPEKWEKVL